MTQTRDAPSDSFGLDVLTRAQAVALILILVAVVLALAAYLAWRTLQVPFPGFFTEPTLVMNDVGEFAWEGHPAEFRIPDRLIAFEGDPLVDSRALFQKLAQHEPGDAVRLTARSEEGTLTEADVTLTPFPRPAFVRFFLLPYALSVIYLGLGAWVLWARWNESSGRAFALMGGVVALGLGVLFDLYTTRWFPRLWVAAISLVGSVAIHFVLVFPQRVRLLDRFPALRYLVYVPGGVLLLINQLTVLDLTRPRAYLTVWMVTFIFVALCAVFFLGLMIHRHRRSQSPVVQGQAKTILWGSVLAFTPIAIWFVVSRFTYWPFPPLLILPWLAFFPISIAYAILRYRLFNIDLVISRGFAYALLAAAVVSVYLLVMRLFGLIFGGGLSAGSPVIVALIAFLLTLLLNTGWQRLRQMVDRLLLGEAANKRELVRDVVGRLAETTDVESILDVVDEALERGWQLAYAALFVYDAQCGRYVPLPIGDWPFPDVTFLKESPVVYHMLNRRESVYLYEDRPLPTGLGVEAERLDPIRPSLLVPVPGHGWMVFGPRRDGAPIDAEGLAALESLGSQIAVALEKARLFEDLERRMTEVDVLRWVGQAVNFTMNVDDLMELIYAQTSRVLDTSNFYITLYNEEKGTLSFAFYVADGERLYPGDEWPDSIGLTGEIVRIGRPIVTDDYTQECLRRGITPGGRPGRAWMGVPLSAGDRVLGVMNVSSFDPEHTYTEEQVQFFSLIADQAAAILEKARLYREMEEWARELAALNEVGSVITSTLDLPAVLSLIMDKSVELLQAEAGSLVMVDEETDELVFEVTTGPGSADLEGIRLPPETGVVGQVIQMGEPIIIRDAQEDDRWYQDLDAQFVTRSIIAVPMISHGRTIGVIELLNRSDGVPFDEEDARLLTAFANDAALAIENARLFTQTDQALADRVEELSMMQRIDRELNDTLNYQRVMEATLDWALRTTGAEIGGLAAVVETEEGRALRFLANRGYPEEVVTPESGELWTLDRGVAGRAVRRGEPCLIEDVSQDPDYVGAIEGTVAQMTVPIQREERIVGVITLETSRRDVLDEEAMAFVKRLADHAAIAIENARLFRQVQRANEAKTEFVSFVSHELKQPMTAIKGYTELLTTEVAGELSDAQHQFLHTIMANVDRMGSLVGELLEVSRIESGRINLAFDEVEIEEAIAEVERALRRQVESKDQRLTTDVSDDLPEVWADPSRVVQVLTNLASNAHKYTPAGGEITIRARYQEDHGEPVVCCSVIDTGIGMTEEDQDRLFTKYFRADDPIVQDEPGTGLGLVITKSLVELQGGEIWVESEPGQGSTFSFTLPVEPAAESGRAVS